MESKEFNNLEEIKKYYDEKTNTYVFKEDGQYINLVVFNFNLKIKADIDALNIKALNIKALNIKARDIEAKNIIAKDIYVFNIECADIDARKINALDINALNITAIDLYADNIDARNIEANNIYASYIHYWAVCFAYNNIKCKSIQGKIKDARGFVLDGNLEIEG